MLTLSEAHCTHTPGFFRIVKTKVKMNKVNHNCDSGDLLFLNKNVIMLGVPEIVKILTKIPSRGEFIAMITGKRLI